MRILVHDYAGHPFQVELSRSLARRGHDVRHVYSASNPTPQGALAKRPDDPATFDSVGIHLREQVDKGSLFKRRAQEIEHGRGVVRQIYDFKPDVFVSANTPLDPQGLLFLRCRAERIAFVYWLQDMLGAGTAKLLSRRLPLVGHVVGRRYSMLEQRLLRDSDGVVLITADFADHIRRPCANTQVIPNWAPLDEMPVRDAENPWSREHGFVGKRLYLYSGTLGMKHNPALLLELADSFEGESQALVVVISEGPGAEWLRQRQAERPRRNLVLMGYQPFEAMPDVLGAAEVLVAVLEPTAGVFCVPSKVLTYLCARRPLLLAVPRENLAARIVEENAAGIVVDPTDAKAFVAAAHRLLGDSDFRAKCSANAREYAERHFRLDEITDRFEDVIRRAAQARGGPGTEDGAVGVHN